MKRILLLLAVLLLLTGCQSLYPDEYLAVNEHEAPFAYRETAVESETATEPAPEYRIASDVFALRDGIQQMALEGAETRQFLLPGYNRERLELAMQDVESALLSSSPKYPYAMDSFEWVLEQADAGAVVTVTMQLRLTPQEIKAIETWIYPEPAMSKVYRALRQMVSSFTVQVSGYQETDFVSLLEDYILHNPDQIVETPDISVSVFPNKGNVRVVEFHFIYSTDRETLRQRRDNVSSLLDFVYSQMILKESAEDMLDVLYMHLPGSSYQEIPYATVYTQVSDKMGSSRTMASVVEYLFKRAGMECELIPGERNGADWYFNRIRVDGEWRYFDLHTAALSKQAPVLLRAGELNGYSWDLESYPDEALEEPAELTEPTEPAEPAEPTEAAASTEAPEIPDTKAQD